MNDKAAQPTDRPEGRSRRAARDRPTGLAFQRNITREPEYLRGERDYCLWDGVQRDQAAQPAQRTNSGKAWSMFRKAAVVAAVLGMAAQVAAQERTLLVRFDGGIGVQPVSNVAGPANADGTFPNVRQNVVRGVPPAGPWRIGSLKANIYTDGSITVRGRGLLLAAGNSIGQNANQRVFATLICAVAGSFVEHSTPPAGVSLEPNGDFRIDDTLSPVPPDCASPVLLIRSSGSGTWFAAGIAQLVDDDR